MAQIDEIYIAPQSLCDFESFFLADFGVAMEERLRIGECRIAADRRQQVELQARAQGRLGVARHVAMPAIAVGEFRILMGMDDEYFRMALWARRGG